ncbi:TetR family transcriptional regulator [Amycolatopsis alkalitolerans]|uniref:TetR family transcriptional regulator n=1 Tax=Amycolatopsis alkalitolerans TaxID=2547244 RepID=A0A5C4LYS6_9PSEU|nr:TetR family transcriptional regulator [Amycolatopsis alkalitolerans]TNC24891.1 TetR family transcriptional regulator [Amycolatopsis alkalitolerans]
MKTEPGLRERKKQQTRRRISDTAIALFAERGFDQVPVAEIARRAEVSEATVFNYFPAKEDLVYAGMATFENALIEAVRAREPGVSVLDAFRDFLVRPRGALADRDPEAMARVATVARVAAGSAALRARERQNFDQFTSALAELLAAESGAPPDDMRAWVVANALMGVNRAMQEAVHRAALDGRTGKRVADRILADGHRALDLLERGLGTRP